MSTPRFQVPALDPFSESPETAHSDAIRLFETAIQTDGLSFGSNTPPGSPSDGDTHIVGASPTGAWSGQAKKIAVWIAASASWRFIERPVGKLWFNQDDGLWYLVLNATLTAGSAVSFTQGVAVATITDSMGNPPTQANMNACKTALNNLLNSLRDAGFFGAAVV